MYCPAAFDIANHFSEWGGFDCDYTMLPSRAVRREFINRYLSSYREHANIILVDFASVANELAVEVDRFRGIPGLWWAIHGFVSVLESKVDFDWIPYANKRLAEYRAWKAGEDGSQLENWGEVPLREPLTDYIDQNPRIIFFADFDGTITKQDSYDWLVRFFLVYIMRQVLAKPF